MGHAPGNLSSSGPSLGVATQNTNVFVSKINDTRIDLHVILEYTVITHMNQKGAPVCTHAPTLRARWFVAIFSAKDDVCIPNGVRFS